MYPNYHSGQKGQESHAPGILLGLTDLCHGLSAPSSVAQQRVYFTESAELGVSGGGTLKAAWHSDRHTYYYCQSHLQCDWNEEEKQRALRFGNVKLGQKACVTVGQEAKDKILACCSGPGGDRQDPGWHLEIRGAVMLLRRLCSHAEGEGSTALLSPRTQTW